MSELSKVARRLSQKGQIEFVTDPRARAGLAAFVSSRFRRPLPDELLAFYGLGIVRVADFNAVIPKRTARDGWQDAHDALGSLEPLDAVPLFSDGAGSYFAADITRPAPNAAVYFFDHIERDKGPHWAAGSSVARFLLLLASHDEAIEKQWSDGWELSIDPDLDKCERAPPIWLAG